MVLFYSPIDKTAVNDKESFFPRSLRNSADEQFTKRRKETLDIQ